MSTSPYKENSEGKRTKEQHTLPHSLQPAISGVITNTPIFFRRVRFHTILDFWLSFLYSLFLQVISPSNLALDSEPSNAAEWSLSMATPTNPQTVKETPIQSTCVSLATTSATNSATTNPTDGERPLDCPSTNESILELRSMLRGNGNRGMYKKQTMRRRHLVHAKNEKVRCFTPF